MHKSLLALAIATTLTACNLAPTYTRPVAPIAQTYANSLVLAGSESSAERPGWQDFFADLRLRALIATALERNRDLAQSMARIDQARAQYRVQASERLPAVGVSGNASKSRQNASALGGGGAAPGGTPATGGIEIEQYSASAGITSFELDLWGRVRNLSEAERLSYLASVEGARAFQLSLISQVAAAYYDILAGEEGIALADKALQGRREGVEIAQVRLDAGLTSTVDYDQAVLLETQAETELATLRRTTEQTRNLLQVLVGGPIDEAALPPPAPLQPVTQLRAIQADLPSSLLVNRPDVLQAELTLQAANANIGAARAAFFPSISLTGQYGYASNELDGLFNNANRSWSYGGVVDLPIFDWGRRKAQLQLSHAQADELVAAYQRAVQQAFQEVADALAARRYLGEQIIAQRRAVTTQRQLADTARLRYENGVSAYLEVLDAERGAFTAEQQLVQLVSSELQNTVTLYAALGGGSSPPIPAE